MTTALLYLAGILPLITQLVFDFLGAARRQEAIPAQDVGLFVTVKCNLHHRGQLAWNE